DPKVFDPDRFTSGERMDLRARYRIAPDAEVVSFLGTFGQWHGADVLASAIARLKQEHASWLAQHKVHFMQIGDGLKLHDVRATIEAAGAEDVCTLTGLVPKSSAPLHLAASDILVSPHIANMDG